MSRVPARRGRQIAAALLVCAALLPGAARADGAKCEVVATGYPGMRGNCRYTATATLGYYDVATTSGFLIMAFDHETQRWRVAVWGVGVRNDPASAVKVQRGTFATKPGELIDVAVTLQAQDLPGGYVWIYQDGGIRGGDVVD